MWKVEQLQRYLTWIDAAILAGNYTLAVALANRCLRESYGSFISYKMPLERTTKNYKNIRRQSVIIVRWMRMYFNRQRIPYPERRLLLMTLVTNILFISMLNTMEQGEEYITDKAMAAYARDNVDSIVRFLMRFM